MRGVTIFTIPKPFIRKHITTIQLNAIKSWKYLDRNIQIILVGNDKGVGKYATKLKVGHIQKVKTNKGKTPLLDSAFDLVREKTNNKILIYVNADIIFTSDLVAIINRLPHDNFLCVGERWDLDIDKRLKFDHGWEKRILQQLKLRGKKHPRYGSDYFIFHRNSFTNIPSFAVGRVGWDNWMIGEALSKGMAVIDASKVNTIIHQNHDYSHLKGGESTKYEINEALSNKKLARNKMKWLESANYVMNELGLRKKIVNWELLINNIKRQVARLK
jgi:hypothetical protein